MDVYLSAHHALATTLVENSNGTVTSNGGGQDYVPTRGVCYTFLVLFSLSTLVHFIQGIVHRKYFMIPTVVFGGILEIVGWAGRVWMSINPGNTSGFQMQITATVLGPTPLVAANFVILGRIIGAIGPQYSRLTPKWYTILFCSADVLSLVIQGTGGGVAASADDSIDQAQTGSNIALAGTVFQLVVVIVYALLKAEFLTRFAKDRPVRESMQLRKPMDKRIKIMVYALVFNTTCLIIRAVYRIIEFADGWDGRIINTEVYFNVLDGMMVVLAIYTLNFAHPGLLLPPKALSTMNDPTIEMGGMTSNDTIIGRNGNGAKDRHEMSRGARFRRG